MPKPSFDQSIRIEQSAVGSTIISGDGNTVNVIHLSLEQTNEQEEVDSLSDLGINPYQGLGVFQESNSEYYFGREAQIERLWQHFQELHERSKQTDSVPRLLPILGPSGCGKSSLARAGLIPELAKQPLSDKTRARVAVLVPGIKPVESLAGVLAKVVTQNSMPVRMAREFQEELHHSNTTGTYDGMRRIVDFIPQINESPLVLLVDQFEEVYSLCEKHNERDVFIKNLLHASSSPTGNVSVVITLRSDFLGETQTHESLNQIISSKYSIFVPAMTKAELRHAIAKPAEKAGFNFSEAMIDLLVKDTENREGALPLLQFALTHMWEEMRKGISPSTTYQSIGGIGGSLAKKAEIIYNSLNQAEKAIARRVFIGLVKLGEGTPDTRRRVTMANLVTNQDNLELVHRVINRFSSPAARLISLSSQSNHKTAEITHETLFDHWTLLRNWIDENREDIRFQRRLETAANYWSQQERATGLLWRSPDLEILRKFSERTQLNMPSLAAEFFAESNKAEKKEKQLKSYGLMGLISGLAVTTTLSIFAGYKVHQAERRRMEFYEVTAENLTDTDVLASLVNGLAAVGLGSSSFVKAPNFRKDALVTPAILDRPNRIRQFSSIASYITQIESVTFNPNGQNVGSGNFDGTVRLWDLQGNPIGEPFLGHSDSVTSVAFSPDGQTIVSGSDDETIRLWDLQGNPIGEPFLGHSDSVTSVAFSPDGQTIVSGSDDETIRLWDLQGNPIKEPFLGHSAPVTSVAFSP
ncbi:MAG: WD40 repeat domain-containing protein, partial [Cyanobacteria bacterium J06650_10]